MPLQTRATTSRPTPRWPVPSPGDIICRSPPVARRLPAPFRFMALSRRAIDPWHSLADARKRFVVRACGCAGEGVLGAHGRSPLVCDGYAFQHRSRRFAWAGPPPLQSAHPLARCTAPYQTPHPFFIFRCVLLAAQMRFLQLHGPDNHRVWEDDCVKQYASFQKVLPDVVLVVGCPDLGRTDSPRAARHRGTVDRSERQCTRARRMPRSSLCR